MALRRAGIYIDKVFYIKNLEIFLQKNLFWNSPLKFIIEGYLALTLQSLTLMSKGLSWSTSLNMKENLFAIIAMIVCGLAPITMTVLFIFHFSQFRKKEFLMRFSSIIGEFNFRNKWSCMFISIFCYRRLVMALLIVFLPSHSYAQVQLITLSSVLVVITFTCSNVYQSSKNTIIEYFNETIILICCYHMFCFTDFVDNPTIRFYIGYSLIAFTTINLGINVLVMLMETLNNLFKKCKTLKICCQKCHYRKRLKKMKER